MSNTLDPLRVPAELWQRADVGEALACRDIGALLRLVHKYARGSQTQIGIAVGLAQGTVSLIMQGKRDVTALEVLERIADGLAMPDEARMRLGLAPRGRLPVQRSAGASADSSSASSGDEGRPRQHAAEAALREHLHQVLAGDVQRPSGNLLATTERLRQAMDRSVAVGSLTVGQVEGLEATVEVSAQQCVSAPPLEMLCRLMLDALEVQGLLRARQSLPVQAGLYRVAARLAALIGDELMVLGDVRQSHAWHRTARTAADQTTDSALRAEVRALAALLPLYYGDVADAVRLARDAAMVGAQNPSVASALAPTIEALGLAQLAAAEAHDALRTAREQAQALDGAYRRESVFGFSERRWNFYEGKILSYLGRSEEAWAIHDQALRLYPEDVVGDPALIYFDRAIGLVRGQQLDAGCALATRTLAELPAEHRTDIFVRAAKRVLAMVPAEQRSRPAVVECREVIRSCVPVGVGG